MPANYSKTIICLANSRKPGGRCVAGKERQTSAWIRPISARATAEINLHERTYQGGAEPEILDIIRISMVRPAPHGHQQENHISDDDYFWAKAGRVQWNDLDNLVDQPPTLWANGHRTAAGHNDRIPAAEALPYRNSLWLVRPRQTAISVSTPGAAYGNPKKAVRAAFQHNGVLYDLKITDGEAEQRYLSHDLGTYSLEQPCSFCISLTEEHTDGYCYKLVATMITAPGQ